MEPPAVAWREADLMSWMRSLALECDRCSWWNDFGVPQPATAAEIRRAAKKAGWRRDGRDREARDLCPSCSVAEDDQAIEWLAAGKPQPGDIWHCVTSGWQGTYAETVAVGAAAQQRAGARGCPGPCCSGGAEPGSLPGREPGKPGLRLLRADDGLTSEDDGILG